MAKSMKTPPDDVVREILLRLDDVVREILLRLDDVVTLFRCAATCKHWRRLVAEPSFLLRRRWPPSLAGFFTQRSLVMRFPGTSPTDSSSQLAFVPAPSSPSSSFGPDRRPLTSFVPNADAPVVDRAVPLVTRGGLLLVRLYPHDDDLEPNVLRLAVCDTLAGRWDVLPELDCSCRFGNSDPCGRAIILSSSGDDRPAFRVLLIGADKYKSQFNLHQFASSERSWSAPAKCFNMMEHQIWFMEEGNAVVCRGNAHWLCVSNSHRFHVLNVDVETGHVSLTKLVCPFVPPTMADHMRLNRLSTTVDGALLSLCVYRGRQLEVGTQQQDNKDRSRDGDAEWLCTRVIDQKLTEVIQQSGCPSCIWSGERSGTLLVTDYATGGMYTAHLDTATLEEVTDRLTT